MTLALTAHLLVPGLCLLQMLSMAPLGGICTTASRDGGGTENPLPDERAERHALEGCDHCVASSAHIAGGTSPGSGLHPQAAAVPRVAPAPALVASGTAWRPPPRGPPNAA